MGSKFPFTKHYELNHSKRIELARQQENFSGISPNAREGTLTKATNETSTGVDYSKTTKDMVRMRTTDAYNRMEKYLEETTNTNTTINIETSSQRRVSSYQKRERSSITIKLEEHTKTQKLETGHGLIIHQCKRLTNEVYSVPKRTESQSGELHSEEIFCRTKVFT